jgi:hypothetical protein
LGCFATPGLTVGARTTPRTEPRETVRGYADLRVMPTWFRKPACQAGIAPMTRLSRSFAPRRALVKAALRPTPTGVDERPAGRAKSQWSGGPPRQRWRGQLTISHDYSRVYFGRNARKSGHRQGRVPGPFASLLIAASRKKPASASWCCSYWPPVGFGRRGFSALFSRSLGKALSSAVVAPLLLPLATVVGDQRRGVTDLAVLGDEVDARTLGFLTDIFRIDQQAPLAASH